MQAARRWIEWNGHPINHHPDGLSGPWLARGVASWRGLFKRGAGDTSRSRTRCFKKDEDVQEIKLFRSSASYSIIAFGALFCFVMIIIVMIMIIIMIFIIIIVIITQPLVGTFCGQGKPASMIYMNGNVRLTITITDALSAYSNHSASARTWCSSSHSFLWPFGLQTTFCPSSPA